MAPGPIYMVLNNFICTSVIIYNPRTPMNKHEIHYSEDNTIRIFRRNMKDLNFLCRTISPD